MQLTEDLIQAYDLWMKYGTPKDPPKLSGRFLKKGYSNFLEIGCGTGYSTMELVELIEQDSNLYLLDINEKSLKLNLENLKTIDKKLNLFTIIHDIENNRLPFEDNKFDIIYIKFVFHQIASPEFILNEIKRIVRPEGCIIVFLKSNKQDEELVTVHEPYLGVGDVANKREFCFETAQDEASKVGLSITHAQRLLAWMEFNDIEELFEYYSTTKVFNALKALEDWKIYLKEILTRLSMEIDNSGRFTVNKDSGLIILRKE